MTRDGVKGGQGRAAAEFRTGGIIVLVAIVGFFAALGLSAYWQAQMDRGVPAPPAERPR